MERTLPPERELALQQRMDAAVYGDGPRIAEEFGLRISQLWYYRRKWSGKRRQDAEGVKSVDPYMKVPHVVGNNQPPAPVELTREEMQRMRSASLTWTRYRSLLEAECRQGNLAALIQYHQDYRARLPLVEAKLPPRDYVRFQVYLQMGSGGCDCERCSRST